MQAFNSLEHEQFLTHSEHGAVAVTVEPRLARQVIRTRLVPTQYKRELLGSRTRTAESVIVDCARESELFYDAMIRLGVMRVIEHSQD